MVYERLAITWSSCVVPLGVDVHCITIVNPSIPVRILGTSRSVYAEASKILKPNIQSLLSEPPELFVEANSLVGLISLRYGFRHRSTLLDVIVRCLASSSVRIAIHLYRRGRLSIEDLRSCLHLERFCDLGSRSTVRGFATFILRATQYRKAKCVGPFPPITLIVDIPAIPQPTSIVITTSRAIGLLQKVFCMQHQRQSYSGPVNVSWLVQAIAYQLQTDCWRRQMTFCLMMRYDHPNCEIKAPPEVLQSFLSAVDLGVQSSWTRHDPCFVYCGGVYQKEGENKMTKKC
jgi:hypothetical protein